MELLFLEGTERTLWEGPRGTGVDSLCWREEETLLSMVASPVKSEALGKGDCESKNKKPNPGKLCMGSDWHILLKTHRYVPCP